MVEIPVPRLAERNGDLPLLERHFIARFAAEYKKDIRGLTLRAQMRLSTHAWPGNVRELENVLGHACMMAMGDAIEIQDLPAYLRSPAGQEGFAQDLAPTPESGALAEQERLLIIRALESAGGSQSEAARILRIGRDALRYKLKKHNLETRAATHRAASGE
jgi:DNA-binding NtrC family response regulator